MCCPVLGLLTTRADFLSWVCVPVCFVCVCGLADVYICIFSLCEEDIHCALCEKHFLCECCLCSCADGLSSLFLSPVPRPDRSPDVQAAVGTSCDCVCFCMCVSMYSPLFLYAIVCFCASPLFAVFCFLSPVPRSDRSPDCSSCRTCSTVARAAFYALSVCVSVCVFLYA